MIGWTQIKQPTNAWRMIDNFNNRGPHTMIQKNKKGISRVYQVPTTLACRCQFDFEFGLLCLARRLSSSSVAT